MRAGAVDPSEEEAASLPPERLIWRMLQDNADFAARFAYR
jgi:hypothetical protein